MISWQSIVAAMAKHKLCPDATSPRLYGSTEGHVIDPRQMTMFGKEDDTKINIAETHSFGKIQKYAIWFQQHWVWELFACSMSILSLMAITIILARYDRKPTPEWPRSITINSALALMTTTMKGSIIFTVSEGISQSKWSWFTRARPLSDFGAIDSASRGPWGSLIFIINHGRRAEKLVLLGVLITVLAVSVDPFAQQVVSYQPCHISSTQGSRAAVPKAQLFDVTARRIGAPTLERIIEATLLNPESNTSNRLQVECNTGNCTFKAPRGFYQTIIISHMCEHTSAKIETNQGEGLSLNHVLRQSDNGNYTLNINSSVLLDTSQYSLSTDRISDYNDSNLFSFHTLLYKRESRNSRGVIPVSFTCSFWPSLVTMSSEVVAGILQELSIDNVTLGVATRSQDIAYLTKLPKSLSNGVWSNCSSAERATDSHIVAITRDGNLRPDYLDPSTGDTTGQFTFHDPSCLAYISKSTVDATTTVLGRFFTAQKIALDKLLPGMTRDVSLIPLSVNAVRDAINQGIPSDLDNKHLEALYLDGNASLASVDRYAASLAGAITAYMRTYPVEGIQGNEPAIGTMQEVKTCARARWVWLALPALLTLLAIVFVTGVILESRRNANDGRWPGLIKSSPMGLFVYGPGDRTLERYEGTKEGVALEYVGEGVSTCLERRWVPKEDEIKPAGKAPRNA